jgi:hypothetical protein
MSHPKLSVRRQCQLLSLNRSSLYSPGKQTAETPANVALMNAIDRQYTQMPYYVWPGFMSTTSALAGLCARWGWKRFIPSHA